MSTSGTHPRLERTYTSPFIATSSKETIKEERETPKRLSLELTSIMYNPEQQKLKVTPRSYNPVSLNSDSLTFKTILYSEQSENQEDKRLEWLKNNGYQSIYSLFSQSKNKIKFPFNEILLLSSPLLMELMVQLHGILEHKKLESTDRMISFVLKKIKEIDQSSHSFFSDMVTPDQELAISFLGKILYLIDSHSEEFLQKLNSLQESDFISWIDSEVLTKLKKQKKTLSQPRGIYKKVALINHKVFAATKLPLIITDLLLTSTYEINFGLIPSITKVFIKKPEKPVNHEISLMYGLTKLFTNPFLRNRLKEVEIPVHQNYTSKSLINISLDRPAITKIKPIDVKKVIIAALLSHLRQTPVGSCFAESIAIELLSCQLEQCLEDFIELIKWGKLERKVQDKKVDFPFLLKSEKHLERLSINEKGTFIDHQEVSLWQIPALISICKILNVENPQQAITQALKTLFESKAKLTVDQFLKELCKESPFQKKIAIDLKTLYEHATLAYESQTSNALLKLWRNAIAGMAEAHTNSLIKSSIIESTMQALYVNFRNISSESEEWLKKYYIEVKKELEERIVLQYDPGISRYKTNSSKKTSGGAFILYDKHTHENFSKWIRVATPQDFQLFILRILKNAREHSSHLSLLNPTHQAHSDIVIQLEKFVESEAFIKDILFQYDKQNKDIVDPLTSFKEISYSPWMTKSGNDSSEVLRVYLQKINEIQPVSIHPKSAEELLKAVIDIGKALTEKEKKAYVINPNKLTPLKTKGIHSFSLMLGHTSLFEAFQLTNKTADWIDTHVKNPGIRIANTFISEETKSALIEFCKNAFITEKNHTEFVEKISLFTHLSHKEFREKLISLIQKLDPLKKAREATRKRLIDSALCRLLPLELREILNQSAVHFADTNWSAGLHDLHFCFIVNPGTGELELFEVYDNNRFFKALEQQQWFIDRSWEYCLPQEVLPENESLKIKGLH